MKFDFYRTSELKGFKKLLLGTLKKTKKKCSPITYVTQNWAVCIFKAGMPTSDMLILCMY